MIAWHVIRKSIAPILVLILLFAVFKFVTLNQYTKQTEYNHQMDQWMVELSLLNDEDTELYLDKIREMLLTDDTVQLSQFSDLNKAYKNRQGMKQLIQFAKEGSGLLPTKLPQQYFERLDFYADLNVPKMINHQTLDAYFQLQTANVVPLITLLVFVMLFGPYYEIQVSRLTHTTPKGRRFDIEMTLIACGICFFLLVCNELADILCSGITTPLIWNAPLQSYPTFFMTQINASIGQTIVALFISKLLGLFLLTTVVITIAKFKKSAKDTLISGALLLVSFLLLSKSLEQSNISPYVQFGFLDWKKMLAATTLSPMCGIPSLYVGEAILAIGLGLLVVSAKLIKNNNFIFCLVTSVFYKKKTSDIKMVQSSK